MTNRRRPKALVDRNAERLAPAPVDDHLRRALRPSGPLQKWRPETAPMAVGGNVFAGQHYDPHEHGPRAGRAFDSPSFDGVLRNTKERGAAFGLGVQGSAVSVVGGGGGAAAAGPAARVHIEEARLESKFPKQWHLKAGGRLTAAAPPEPCQWLPVVACRRAG